MKESSNASSGTPGDFVTQDDEGLFAYINTLRLSVRAKVAAEQQHGLSLSEIVVQVREMVRLAEQEVLHPKAFPSHTLRAISRQAVAWCIEAYQPIVFAAGNEPNELNPQSLPQVPAPDEGSVNRFPRQSPT